MLLIGGGEIGEAGVIGNPAVQQQVMLRGLLYPEPLSPSEDGNNYLEDALLCSSHSVMSRRVSSMGRAW